MKNADINPPSWVFRPTRFSSSWNGRLAITREMLALSNCPMIQKSSRLGAIHNQRLVRNSRRIPTCPTSWFISLSFRFASNPAERENCSETRASNESIDGHRHARLARCPTDAQQNRDRRARRDAGGNPRVDLQQAGKARSRTREEDLGRQAADRQRNR